MGKTAIIDIDNTLWQFCDAFYLELQKINRDFPTPDQWSTFDFWEGCCLKAEFVAAIAAIAAIHRNQDSDRYEPYPESQGFLSSLKEHGFHIILTSQQHVRNKMSRIDLIG